LGELLAGEADGLAREPRTDEFDRLEVVRSDIVYVLVSGDMGPVLSEYLPAKRVALHLPHYPMARTLEPQIEAAHAAEEGAGPHARPLVVPAQAGATLRLNGSLCLATASLRPCVVYPGRGGVCP
jgi:hypothetical protein